MKAERSVLVVRFSGVALLILYICLHFFLTIYEFEIFYNKRIKLSYGLGITRPAEIALIFFVIGFILIFICFLFLKREWKIPLLLFLILYVLHFIVYTTFNLNYAIYVNLVFWSGLFVISTIIIFYKKEDNYHYPTKTKRIEPKYRGVLS